ncbi:MAG: hypothetical protein B7X11_02520, partial [Acidobacteria bacterium 37-65-4]
GILALIALLTGAGTSAFSFTEKGRQAQLDFQVQQMERFGVTVTDEMYARMEEQSQKRAAYAPFLAIVGTFIIFPIIILVVSGIFYAVFNAIMGGTAEFKQVMAVTSHAWMVPTLGAIFGGIMNFARGSISSSVANLGLLLPVLKEGSFAANLAGAVDLFQIWFVLTLSIGLGVLYKRKTSSIATGLFVVYAIVAIGLSYFLRKG